MFNSKNLKKRLRNEVRNVIQIWDENQINDRINNPEDYEEEELEYTRTSEEKINEYVREALKQPKLKKYIKDNFLKFTVIDFVENEEENIEELIKKYIRQYNTHIFGYNHEVKFDENEDDEDCGGGKYSVYKHTSPSGKSYIGITKNNPEKRWKGGWGYYEQTKFFNAIKKYGWENFNHEVLETGLSLKKAWEREKYYIAKFDSFGNGYNADEGGRRYVY